MNKILLAMAALLGMTSVAVAQTKPTNTGFFVGGFIGSSTTDRDRVNIGVNGGYQFNQFLRAEGTFDHAWKAGVGGGSRVMVNAVGQYRIPSTSFTPYVLTGVGYGFDSLGTVKKGGAVPLWNVGTGLRYAMTERVDVDLRYRYVQSFNGRNTYDRDAHVFTVGAGYKF
jgi:opacity protein-like surface antigen